MSVKARFLGPSGLGMTEHFHPLVVPPQGGMDSSLENSGTHALPGPSTSPPGPLPVNGEGVWGWGEVAQSEHESRSYIFIPLWCRHAAAWVAPHSSNRPG